MNKLVKNTVTEINKLHSEIEINLRVTLKIAIKVGGLLDSVKKELPHGKYSAWVETHLSFTTRTARNYRRLYLNKGEIKTETVSVLEGYKSIDKNNSARRRLEAVGMEAEQIDSLIKTGCQWSIKELEIFYRLWQADAEDHQLIKSLAEQFKKRPSQSRQYVFDQLDDLELKEQRRLLDRQEQMKRAIKRLNQIPKGDVEKWIIPHHLATKNIYAIEISKHVLLRFTEFL